ncbi:MAG: hypothetical protein K6G12_03100 [Lachnospiraceae bacterium]|nr:hypothetical protein [Lachnospiraceae bacterium]
MVDFDKLISQVSDIFDDDRKLLERKAKVANDLFNLLADHEISLDNETDARKSDYESFTSLLSAFENKIADLTEQNNQLRADKEQIQAQYKQLQGNYEQLKAYVNDLNKRKLDRRDKEAQQRGQIASRERRTEQAENRNRQMAVLINKYLYEFKGLSVDQAGDIRNTIDWADLVNRTKIQTGHAIYKDFADWLQTNYQLLQGNYQHLYHYYMCRRVYEKHDLFKNIPKA